MQTLLNLQFMLKQICCFIQKKIHETLLVKVSWIVFVAHVLKVESGLTQLSRYFRVCRWNWSKPKLINISKCMAASVFVNILKSYCVFEDRPHYEGKTDQHYFLYTWILFSPNILQPPPSLLHSCEYVNGHFT